MAFTMYNVEIIIFTRIKQGKYTFKKNPEKNCLFIFLNHKPYKLKFCSLADSFISTNSPILSFPHPTGPAAPKTSRQYAMGEGHIRRDLNLLTLA